MADFSLTTLFVVPVGNTLPSSGSTQNLAAGQFGFFLNTYAVANSGNINAAPYFYIAQGRANTYLEGSKRSDKIKGCVSANCTSNVTSFRKVVGCAYPVNQITEVDNFAVKCGEVVTLTIRAHSSYIDSLYYNGYTKSVTVQAPCCDCDGDPCENVDVEDLVDSLISKLNETPPGNAANSISLSKFLTFSRVGADSSSVLHIEGKPLTKYGQPCDVSAFPHEYDRLWFSVFVYTGPATTADFIVADACNVVADVTTVQESNFATGTSEEIKQLEKNYHSYQSTNKHLYTLAGYNPTFESYVTDGTVYDTFYIRFNDIDKSFGAWNPSVQQDSTVIIACPQALTAGIETVLEAALGSVDADNGCVTTTTTTTQA